MLIIGHRGIPGLEPENTIRSFKAVQEYGVDMIEIDVRRAGDGELVVIHDADLFRLFGSKEKIQSTPTAELKRISQKAGREIPTLAEALASIDVAVNIHVKVHGIEARILEHLKNFSHKVLISCTFPGVLKKIRTLDEKIELGLLVGPGELHLVPILRFLTRSLKLHSIHPKLVLVNAVSIKILKTLGRKVYVWTVNTVPDYERMKHLKIDGIFTDFANLMTK